jgi:hypothetical protein
VDSRSDGWIGRGPDGVGGPKVVRADGGEVLTNGAAAAGIAGIDAEFNEEFNDVELVSAAFAVRELEPKSPSRPTEARRRNSSGKESG